MTWVVSLSEEPPAPLPRASAPDSWQSRWPKVRLGLLLAWFRDHAGENHGISHFPVLYAALGVWRGV